MDTSPPVPPGRPPVAASGDLLGPTILVLRSLKDGTSLFLLARDAGNQDRDRIPVPARSPGVIAARLPDLPDVLEGAGKRGGEYVCLDDTLIATTRCSAHAGEDARSDL